MPRKPEDAYQHGNLREALVQAGLKLLSEGGIEKLSLRAAAQLAGVSHAAPYRHFRDKDALVGAIAQRGFELLATRMRDEVKRLQDDRADGRADQGGAAPGLSARLTATAVGYVSFALEHPGYFRVIFSGLSCAVPSPELQQAGASAYNVLRDLIVEGVQAGMLRDGDPEELALAAWSLVHGIGMFAVDGALEPRLSGKDAFVAMTRRLTALLQVGLQAPGSRPAAG